MDEILRELAIFDSLNESELETVSGRFTHRNLEADEVLIKQGEQGNRLFVVVDGLLRVSRKSEDLGRDKILTYLDKGSVVGEMAVFGDQKRSATVTAIRPSSLLEITRDNFRAICRDNSTIPINMLSILTGRLYTSNTEIDALTFRTVPGRLALKLLGLAEEFGEPGDEPDSLRIPVSLTHKNLADLIGTNRETVTRYVNKFQDQGAIEVEDQIYTILDRSKLENWI